MRFDYTPKMSHGKGETARIYKSELTDLMIVVRVYESELREIGYEGAKIEIEDKWLSPAHQ